MPKVYDGATKRGGDYTPTDLQWRAFLEGMDIPYHNPPKSSVSESIISIIEAEQIRPQRVATLLGMTEESILATINGCLSGNTESAKDLGAIIKAVRERDAHKKMVEKSDPHVGFLLEYLGYEANAFHGTMQQAAAFIFANAGTSQSEFLQQMKVSEESFGELIKRAAKSETSTEILGNSILKMLRHKAEEDALKEEQAAAQRARQAALEEQAAAQRARQAALEEEAAQRAKKAAQGKFAQWVQGIRKHNNAKVLAKKWQDKFGEPMFTPDQVDAMAGGILVPTVEQLIRIVHSERISNVPMHRQLFVLAEEQRKLLAGLEGPSR